MSDRPAAEQTAPAPVDPWDRYGWVMGAVWLVFLGFPLTAAITVDRSLALRVLAIALIACFAAVYLHGFVRLKGDGSDEPQTWAHVVGATAIALSTAPIIGPELLGMAPFVASLAVFHLPLRSGLAALSAVVAGCVGVVLIGGEPGLWFLVGIVVLIGVAGAVVRVLDDAGTRHQATVGDLAVVAERERVARDVHDVLGHSLTVLTVKAELAERLVDSDPERAKHELAQIRDLTRQSLAEIRATVGGLRVARLGDELEASRAALADAGIEAELPADPAVVDPRHRIVLAWALRESVTNVVRHSRAATCTVELGPDWLSVADDGHGLNGSVEGNGLRGLRERVTAAGGAVEVTGDAGTRVRVQL